MGNYWQGDSRGPMEIFFGCNCSGSATPETPVPSNDPLEAFGLTNRPSVPSENPFPGSARSLEPFGIFPESTTVLESASSTGSDAYIHRKFGLPIGDYNINDYLQPTTPMTPRELDPRDMPRPYPGMYPSWHPRDFTEAEVRDPNIQRRLHEHFSTLLYGGPLEADDPNLRPFDSDPPGRPPALTQPRAGASADERADRQFLADLYRQMNETYGRYDRELPRVLMSILSQGDLRDPATIARLREAMRQPPARDPLLDNRP